MCELKTYYSAQELIDLDLTRLPTTKKAVIDKAKRENWQSRPRQGRGGGVEYALNTLPPEVQQEIRTRFAVSVVQSKPKPPAVRAEIDVSSLTNKQREASDAKGVIVTKVFALQDSGMSQEQAVNFFCEQAKKGDLPPEMQDCLKKANAKPSANRTVSPRTLKTWIKEYKTASNPEERLKNLAPRVRQPVAVESLNWLPEFLAVYRNTNGVNVTEAYYEFSQRWQMAYHDQPLWLELMPSLHQEN